MNRKNIFSAIMVGWTLLFFSSPVFANTYNITLAELSNLLNEAVKNGDDLGQYIGKDVEDALNQAGIRLAGGKLFIDYYPADIQVTNSCWLDVDAKNISTHTELYGDSSFEFIYEQLNKPIISSITLYGAIDVDGKLRVRFGFDVSFGIFGREKCIRYATDNITFDFAGDFEIGVDLIVNANPEKVFDANGNIIGLKVTPTVDVKGRFANFKTTDIEFHDVDSSYFVLGAVSPVLAPLLAAIQTAINEYNAGSGFIDSSIETNITDAFNNFQDQARVALENYMGGSPSKTFYIPDSIDPEVFQEIGAVINRLSLPMPVTIEFTQDHFREILYALLIGDREYLLTLLGAAAICQGADRLLTPMPYVATTPSVSEMSYADFCADVAVKDRLGNPAVAGSVPLNTWTRSPGTRLDVGVLSIKDNFQPYMQKVKYKEAAVFLEDKYLLTEYAKSYFAYCQLTGGGRFTDCFGYVYKQIEARNPDFVELAPRGTGVCQLEMRVYKKDIAAQGLMPLLAIHGGSWQYRGPFWGIESQVSHYTEKGFVVFAPFYRLVGESDGNYECNGSDWESITKDIEDAFTWIQSNASLYGATGPIRVMGQSAGGHLAGWLSVHDPTRANVGRAVLLYPPADMADFRNQVINGLYTNRTGIRAAEAFVGMRIEDLLEDDPVVVKNDFPSKISQNLSTTPSIYLMHGHADDLVPSRQSVRLCNALSGSLNFDYGPAADDGGSVEMTYACDNEASELHVIEEGLHALDFCVEPLGCPAGSINSQAAIRAALARGVTWLAETELGADLTMTAVSGPTSAGAGTSIAITNTVKNQGSGASGAFYVSLYLSTDAIIAATDTYLGYRSVSPSLGIGASSSVSTAVTIPSSLAEGTYYIGAIADSTTLVVETNESNNTTAGNTIMVARPDLIMTALSGPTSGTTGGNISISNSVKNLGTPAGTFRVGLYLSTDNVITAGDVFLGSRSFPSLATGAISTVSTSVTIPTTIGAGTYYIGALADYDNKVAEGNQTNTAESNNVLTGNVITISVGPDLIITAVSGPTSRTTGGNINISNSLKNEGTTKSGSLDVGLYLSTDNVITTGDIFLGSRTLANLAAATTSTVTTTVMIPGIAPGIYYIGAVADYNSTVVEKIETNNTKAGNTITIIAPDLVMTAVSGPASGTTGASFTTSNTVKNQSNGSAGTFKVGLYLSTDNVITTDDIFLGSRSLTSLLTGTVSTVSTSVTIPTTIGAGTYYVGAIADYDNKVSEGNSTNTAETNNTLAGNSITISIGSDLIITAVSASGVVGGSISISNSVKNQGTTNPGAFNIGLYLSADDVITTGDIFLGSRALTSLAAGTNNSATTTVTIPTDVAAGTYYLGGIADYLNLIVESNEINNSQPGNTITIGAELVMTAVSTTTTSALVLGNITISDTVKNQGTINSSGFNVHFYLSTDTTITDGVDTWIGNHWVNSLAPGASVSPTTTVTIPIWVNPGTYYLGAIAEHPNDTNLSNNAVASSTTITITTPPTDLAELSVSTTSTSAPVLGNITISDTVKNQGAINSSGLNVHFYLSTDTTITDGVDTWIGSHWVNSLAPGASFGATTAVTLPNWVNPGTYYLGAIAEYPNDTNLSNNAVATTTTMMITASPTDLAELSVSTTSTSAPVLGNITISDTVKNQGAINSSGFNVHFYLSTDTTITDGVDTWIGNHWVDSLASGASFSATTTVTIPSWASPGTYYLGAIAEYPNDTNLSNNAVTYTTTITITAP